MPGIGWWLWLHDARHLIVVLAHTWRQALNGKRGNVMPGIGWLWLCQALEC